MGNLDNLDVFTFFLFAILFFVFIYFTRKRNNFENYSVANRSVGIFLLFASSSANYIGPGFTMGLVGKGYYTGFLFFFIMLVYGLSKMFEGIIIAPHLRKKFKKAYTIGGIVGGEDSHNNKLVQFVAGLLSFFLMIGFCGVMTMAGGTLIKTLLGVSEIWGIVILTAISVFIAVFGGLRSSMMSDLLQFCLFVILLPALGIISIIKADISFDTFSATAQTLTSSGFDSFSTITILGLLVVWFFGEMLVPPTVSCILSSKDSKTARKALTYSGLFMIVWLFLMLSLGIISNAVGIESLQEDSILYALGTKYFHSGLFGLFIVALLGTIITTQDSLINSASVILSIDIVNVIKEGSAKRNLIISKASGIFVGCISIIFALKIPSILDGLASIYSVWAPSILVVMMTSIFLKKVYWQSALASMVFGATTAIISQKLFVNIPAIFIGVFFSLLSYFIVHYICKVSPR